MGETSTETAKEIEDVKGRLEDGIHALENRIPTPPKAAKKAGMALGAAGVALLLGRALSKRSRKRVASKIESAQELIPEKVREAVDDVGWTTWAGVAAGAWLVFRLSELRQLRKINKALRR